MSSGSKNPQAPPVEVELDAMVHVGGSKLRAFARGGTRKWRATGRQRQAALSSAYEANTFVRTGAGSPKRTSCVVKRMVLRPELLSQAARKRRRVGSRQDASRGRGGSHESLGCPRTVRVADFVVRSVSTFDSKETNSLFVARRRPDGPTCGCKRKGGTGSFRGNSRISPAETKSGALDQEKDKLNPFAL